MSQTGYPSIDKPWLKYYPEDAINDKISECTMYEYIRNNNKNHLDDDTILYFGRRFKYREVFAKIDQTAAAFIELGVKKGDIVTIQSLSIPQVVFVVYALSKIGAVANLLFANTSSADVKKNLAETKSRILMVLEPMYNTMKEDLADTSLDAVIVLGIQDEMPILTKVGYTVMIRSKKVKPKGKVMSWEDFFAIGKGKNIEVCGRGQDQVIMVYTGGTTGKSKGVMLSNHSMNVAAKQYLQLGYERKKTLLCVLPPFIAFGMTVTIHMPMSFGVKVALCVSPNPTQISEFVKRYHPDYIICGTAQAENLVISLENKKIDLSNLTFFGVGGDALSLALEKRVNDFLEKKHSKTRIIQGYAMSETAASSTAAVHKIYKSGTVGIPFVYTTVKIVDPNTEKELPYGESGEICINTPCTMMGYYKDEKETENILHTHEDGKLWVHTGDIGIMDEDGFIEIIGRIKRMILVSERDLFHKVFPKLLEDELLRTNIVQSISIVGRANLNTTNDLIAFVVVNNGVTEDQAIKVLKEYANSHLKTFERPARYVVVDKLPLTAVGKVDYRKLEQKAAKE